MFIYPIFISDDPDAEQVISSLPGQKRWGLNKLEGFLRPLVGKGLKGVILFGVPMEMEKVGFMNLVEGKEELTNRTNEDPPQTTKRLRSSRLCASSPSCFPS